MWDTVFYKIVGYQRACEYILTSKTFTAEEAYRLGIINKVVDAEKLDVAVEDVVSAFVRFHRSLLEKQKC